MDPEQLRRRFAGWRNSAGGRFLRVCRANSDPRDRAPLRGRKIFRVLRRRKAKSLKNAHRAAPHKHVETDRKRAHRVEKGAEDEVVDDHTQRAPRELRCCAARQLRAPARAARRLTGPTAAGLHKSSHAQAPRLSSTTPKHGTLQKQKPYLRTVSRTTRSAAGRQQHGNHAL